MPWALHHSVLHGGAGRMSELQLGLVTFTIRSDPEEEFELFFLEFLSFFVACKGEAD